MAYSARQLITEAYYLSGLYSRRLETLDGADISFGLKLLNDLIADKTVDITLIPFYREYQVSTVQGESIYYITGLVEIETETFNIQDTRFGTQRLSRKEFFGYSRQD